MINIYPEATKGAKPFRPHPRPKGTRSPGKGGDSSSPSMGEVRRG